MLRHARKRESQFTDLQLGRLLWRNGSVGSSFRIDGHAPAFCRSPSLSSQGADQGVHTDQSALGSCERFSERGHFGGRSIPDVVRVAYHGSVRIKEVAAEILGRQFDSALGGGEESSLLGSYVDGEFLGRCPAESGFPFLCTRRTRNSAVTAAVGPVRAYVGEMLAMSLDKPFSLRGSGFSAQPRRQAARRKSDCAPLIARIRCTL